MYRSASALGASARAKVAGAGAVLRPVSSGTQVLLFLDFETLWGWQFTVFKTFRVELYQKVAYRT